MKFFRIDEASYAKDSKGKYIETWTTRALVAAWSAGHALDRFPKAAKLRVKAEASFIAYAYGETENLEDPAAMFKASPALPEDLSDKTIDRIL